MAENNKLTDQAKGFVSRLSMTQRIIIGSVIAIIIVGLISIIMFSGEQNEWTTLYKDLEEEDAGKIVEQLQEKNIDYKLEDKGRTILVDEEKVYNVRLEMANEGLPASGVPGYEIFDQTNLGMSEFVQKLNYRRALEGELARTISSLDDVKKVRVHIVIPETRLFKADQKDPTASVSLHLKNEMNIGKISIEGIQNLVASSVEGMSSDNVTVVDHRGKILSPPPLDENSIAGLTSAQHEQQATVEQYLSNKVQSLLDGVLGYGNSEVRVNTELDFTRIERTITDFDPDRQVTRSEQQIVEQSESSDSLSYPAVNMAKDESNIITNYEISKTVQNIVEDVGNIKRLSVAVMINGTHNIIEKTDGLKEFQYTPRTNEEMEKLTLIVKNAIGYDPSRNDQISVINVPFDTMVDKDELKELNLPPWYERPDNIKLFLLIGSMIIVIFMLYGLLRSKAIRDRLRIAMELPEKVSIDDEELDEHEEEEEELEDLDLDDDDLLMLPGELPEQLMLEGEDRSEAELTDMDEDFGGGMDKNALAERARAELDGDQEEITEERMMRLEMKSKVEEYADDQPQEAAKLVKMFILQDYDSGGFNI